jgi:hypothetical protein
MTKYSEIMSRCKWDATVRVNLDSVRGYVFTIWTTITLSRKVQCHRLSFIVAPLLLITPVSDRLIIAINEHQDKRSATLSRVPLAVWHANLLIKFATPDTANCTSHTATRICILVCDVTITALTSASCQRDVMRPQVPETTSTYREQLWICRIISHRQPTMGSFKLELGCRTKIPSPYGYEVGQKVSCKAYISRHYVIVPGMKKAG